MYPYDEVITYDAYPDASTQIVDTPHHADMMENFLNSASWFCGIVYAILFGGSLAF